MSVEIKKQFGKQIRSLRKERGWTIAELAEHCNLSDNFNLKKIGVR
ncbi:MAG: helix-turn-helix transcriptional regulator [Bacteroidota bacterium]